MQQSTPTLIKSRFTSSTYLFMLTCCVMFIAGLSYGLLDVMNRNLQIHMELKRTGLIQGIYFSCYVLIAIPSGLISQRIGFRYGMVMGLTVFIIGALTISTAAWNQSFYLFLLAFFVMACGVVCLDSNTNPMLITLGETNRSSMRINLGQAIGSIGVSIGPFIGGNLFLKYIEPSDKLHNLQNVAIVYFIVAVMTSVLVILLVLAKTKQNIEHQILEIDESANPFNGKKLWQIKHFRYGFLALMLFSLSQVGVVSNFIPFTEIYWPDATSEKASYLLGIGLFLYLLGRIVTTPMFEIWNSHQILTTYAVITLVCILIAGLGIPYLSVIALIAILYLFSICYPTIFALSVAHLPSSKMKLGSAIIVMGSIGAAAGPILISYLAGISSYAIAMWVVFPCYVYIAWYAYIGSKLPPILRNIAINKDNDNQTLKQD